MDGTLNPISFYDLHLGARLRKDGRTIWEDFFGPWSFICFLYLFILYFSPLFFRLSQITFSAWFSLFCQFFVMLIKKLSWPKFWFDIRWKVGLSVTNIFFNLENQVLVGLKVSPSSCSRKGISWIFLLKHWAAKSSKSFSYSCIVEAFLAWCL